MQMIDATAVDRLLAYPDLVDVLERGFRVGAISPLRHHHQIERDGRPDLTLLIMPAWTASAPGAATAGAYAGIKLVTVGPDNGAKGLPGVMGQYLLIATDSGLPLALIDGPALTAWRTAAASALASRHLSRPDASRLAMIGAGALAPYLIRAHASVRPIREVVLWNRSRANAEALAARLAATGLGITIAETAEAAVRGADIVSTATISSTPVIEGRWLSPGQHVDCVGAFRPTMRETDDEVVQRASLWVDTMAGGLHEAGDIVIPLKAGVIGETSIRGDLFGLAGGTAPRRTSNEEITMFKSVGASLEDLFTAVFLYERHRAETGAD